MDDLKVTTSLLKIMRDIATMKEPINKEIFKLICLTYE